MKKYLTVIIFLLFLDNLRCWGETISDYIFKPKPISQSECEKIKDQYGISSYQRHTDMPNLFIFGSMTIF